MSQAPAWVVLLAALGLLLPPLLGLGAYTALGLAGLPDPLAGRLGFSLAIGLVGLAEGVAAWQCLRHLQQPWYFDRVLISAATVALLSPLTLALVWLL